MNKAAIVLATAGAVGLGAIATSAPAKADPWGWGPAIAGGVIAGAALGGLASTAYGGGPYGYPGPYGYYDGYAPAYYGGYGPGYYDSFAYDADVAPYGYATTYAVEPTYYSYRRVVRPAFGYRRSFAFYGGPRFHHRHWRHY